MSFVRTHLPRHLRARRDMWGRFWVLPVAPFLAYAGVVSALGQLRGDHVLVVVAAAVLAYATPKTKRLFLAGFPYFLVGLLFDSLRYAKLSSVDRVLGCQLREAELAVFGVGSGAGRMTLNDFFSIHHHPIADVLCAVPYGAYLFVMIGHWAWLYWKDDALASRFAQVVLVTHLLGFATYLLVPAAPPWYVRAHGCALSLDAKMSAAALTRVDALFDMHYFHDLYARGSRVFGALPSLHITYPLYGLYVTWQRSSRPVRAVQSVYAVAMMFSAVYLDHHYVWDVALGLTYATISFLGVQAFVAARAKRRVAAAAGPSSPVEAAALRGTSVGADPEEG